MENPNSDYQAAFEIGLAQEPIELNGQSMFQIVPKGCEIHDFEHAFSNPRRATGTINFHDSDSLIAYVERHKTDATQAIAGDSERWKIEVCLNHHTKDVPGWGDHKAVFRPPISRQWEEWATIDRRPMNQQDFSDFIEDHIPDIYSPDGADLLSICSTFTRSAKSEFTQNRRLEDGSYSITVSDEGKSEGQNTSGQKVTVPDRLGLSLPVFRYEGGDTPPAILNARLRTRVTDGKLTFTIRLQGADEVLETAQQSLIDKVNVATGIRVYRGSSL